MMGICSQPAFPHRHPSPVFEAGRLRELSCPLVAGMWPIQVPLVISEMGIFQIMGHSSIHKHVRYQEWKRSLFHVCREVYKVFIILYATCSSLYRHCHDFQSFQILVTSLQHTHLTRENRLIEEYGLQIIGSKVCVLGLEQEYIGQGTCLASNQNRFHPQHPIWSSRSHQE